MLVGQVGWVSSDSVEGEMEGEREILTILDYSGWGGSDTPWEALTPLPTSPSYFFFLNPSVIPTGMSIYTASVTKNSAPYPYPACRNINESYSVVFLSALPLPPLCHIP